MLSTFKIDLRKFLSNDAVLAAFFLIAYLCTNSYIYGWDDQHLEIPLLKHLIDPSLYKGDYYVESLAGNFSSYFYPLLAKCISVDQIPSVYFVLFLISRYFSFLFIYKIWHYLSKDRFIAVCAVMMFMVLGRTEEFLYRTFSHQTANEAFLFAGLYFFFKERYFLAAFVFGIAANIHAIYNLFPMLFMLSFLLIFHPQRWSMFFKTGGVFTAASLPFLCWQIPRSLQDKLTGTAVPVSEWMPLYFQSCPQNFLFFDTPLVKALADKAFLFKSLEPYMFVFVLYVFLLFVLRDFRKDKKTHVLIWFSFALIIFSCIFTYVIPSRFVLDLNLLRCEQFIRFMLMGYTAWWAVKVVREGKPWQALAAAMVFLFIGFGSWSVFLVKLQKYALVLAGMAVVFILLQFRLLSKWEHLLRKALIILPLLGGFAGFCMFHYNYVQIKKTGGGFWQLQRNWEDMQRYVKKHTPKESFILTPINTDMGGFRIQSERKTLVCIRDCGIIGFDYKATLEWRRRMDDLRTFIVMAEKPVEPSLLVGIFKYKVDYIVFMNYYAPKEDNPIMEKVYQNEVFSLFKVKLRS